MPGRKLKDFSGWHIDGYTKATDANGRAQSQHRIAVRASSQKAAAEAIGCTLYFFRDFIGETGNAETIAALDEYPPLTVLVAPMDPGGTIDGTPGWRPRAR
jgi:hypothetical protein